MMHEIAQIQLADKNHDRKHLSKMMLRYRKIYNQITLDV